MRILRKNFHPEISGPLLDRIYLHVEVPLVNFRELYSNTNHGEKSELIRSRDVAARGIQSARFKKNLNSTNSAMASRQARQHCQLTAEGACYLEHAMEEMNFSARAHDRILKVASTLADLAGAETIHTPISPPSGPAQWLFHGPPARKQIPSSEGHSFFNRDKYFELTLAEMDRFLIELGRLEKKSAMP